MSAEELAELLYRSLLAGDEALMKVVARNAVNRYAGMEPGRPVGRYVLSLSHPSKS